MYEAVEDVPPERIASPTFPSHSSYQTLDSARQARSRANSFERDSRDDDSDTVVDTQVSTVVSTVSRRFRQIRLKLKSLMPLALPQAVGTDLSSLRPPARRRSVSFGANEVEEFNGSEAPDAIEPAPSRQGTRTPVPPSNGMLVRAVPIERPASRGYDRESYVRDSPATRAMPPPPVPSTTQRVPSRAHLRESRVPAYPQASIERTQSYGSPHFAYDDGGDDGDLPAEDDDDDAFTALADSTVVADSTAGTGVASDLSFDYDPNPRRTSSGENGRPSFPSMRDSPNTAQMYRPSYTRASASGFDHTYFAHPEPAEAPAFSSATAGRDAGIGSKLGRLAPPPSIERPRSTGSLREPMRLDEDSYAGGISRGRTPTNRIASSYSRATEDSPIEKELIALLKVRSPPIASKESCEIDCAPPVTRSSISRSR